MAGFNLICDTDVHGDDHNVLGDDSNGLHACSSHDGTRLCGIREAQAHREVMVELVAGGNADEGAWADAEALVDAETAPWMQMRRSKSPALSKESFSYSIDRFPFHLLK